MAPPYQISDWHDGCHPYHTASGATDLTATLSDDIAAVEHCNSNTLSLTSYDQRKHIQ